MSSPFTLAFFTLVQALLVITSLTTVLYWLVGGIIRKDRARIEKGMKLFFLTWMVMLLLSLIWWVFR